MKESRKIQGVRRVAMVMVAGACSLMADHALAQIALPPVQLPEVRRLEPPLEIVDTVADTAEVLSSRQLQEARLLRVRELLRSNRGALEADSRGAPIIRAELVAIDPAAAAVEQARAAGFVVGRERLLEGLETRLVILLAPEGMSTTRALRRLRTLDPGGTYDFNHLYMEGGEAGGPMQLEAAAGLSSPIVASNARVGLIDGGVDVAHAAFRTADIRVHGCEGRAIASGHGTAVASLIAGRVEQFHGAAPGAVIYAADVYCGLATGGAVDAVADAFAWLVREHVPVINVSLVGPANVTLEAVVRKVLARGHCVVAAVGNDGPAAKPLYPAAYDGVIGVTGVDARRRVLVEAGRGPHVDFAAPGADIVAAGSGQTFATVRGTSFAAPIVAGLLAARLQAPDQRQVQEATAVLVLQAVDLGSKGRDRIYGAGLVGEELRVALTAGAGVK